MELFSFRYCFLEEISCKQISLRAMKWEETLRYKLENPVQADNECLYQICRDAYEEGCVHEKSLAMEAYRLRCCHLFGDKCMMISNTIPRHIKICDGTCGYMRKYEFELYKLEDCVKKMQS